MNSFLSPSGVPRALNSSFWFCFVGKDEILLAVQHQRRDVISRSKIPRINLRRLSGKQASGHQRRCFEASIDGKQSRSMRRSPADRIKTELRGIDVASCLEVIDRLAQVPGPLEGTFTLLLGRKEPLGWTSLQRAPVGRNHNRPPGTNQELIRITVL